MVVKLERILRTASQNHDQIPPPHPLSHTITHSDGCNTNELKLTNSPFYTCAHSSTTAVTCENFTFASYVSAEKLSKCGDEAIRSVMSKLHTLKAYGFNAHDFFLTLV